MTVSANREQVRAAIHTAGLSNLASDAAADAVMALLAEATSVASCPHVDTSDEGTSYCRLAEPPPPSPGRFRVGHSHRDRTLYDGDKLIGCVDPGYGPMFVNALNGADAPQPPGAARGGAPACRAVAGSADGRGVHGGLTRRPRRPTPMGDGLQTITVHQPWASLIAAGVKTIETRSWSTKHRGRIGIHAAKRVPEPHLGPMFVGEFHVAQGGTWLHGPDHDAPMVFGGIVATAELVDVVPIEDLDAPASEVPTLDAPAVVYVRPREDPEQFALYVRRHQVPTIDVEMGDQLPYGDYAAGRFAWLLEDIKPTTERCPWCWGSARVDRSVPGVPPEVCIASSPCPVCWPRTPDGGLAAWADGSEGSCRPIPARGRQRLWTWTPETMGSPEGKP